MLTEPHPPRQSERALAKLWLDADLLGADLTAQDGRQFRVLYPGRPNGRAGPDFKDSVLETDDGELLRGDVELHVDAGDWRRHGHHTDPNYNGVVLHVVLRSRVDASPQQSNMVVPVVSLAGQEGTTGSPRRDRPSVLRSRGRDEIGPLLDRAGDLRLLGRSRGFAIQMGSSEGEQLLYEAIMDALGYASNRKPFRALAQAVPMALLREVAGEPASTRLLALKAMLLDAAGLAAYAGQAELRRMSDVLPRLPTRKQVPVALWHTFRVRPANHPARRILGAAHLFDRYLDPRLPEGLTDLMAAGRPTDLIEGLTAPPYVGTTRAKEIAVNAVLPFIHARAGLTRDGHLQEQCLDVYRRFPSLPDNEITREMKRLWSPEFEDLSPNPPKDGLGDSP